MPRHHTNDPVKRAEHIANHLEKEKEKKVLEHLEISSGLFELWPENWLRNYDETLKEIIDDPEND